VKFSLAWLLLSLAALGLCLASPPDFYGIFVSIYLFLCLSLRAEDGTIRAEARPKRLCLNFLISHVTSTLIMVALSVGIAVYLRHYRVPRPHVTFNPRNVFTISLILYSMIHFVVLLPVAIVVWMVGRTQQRRRAVTGLEEPTGE
jgi:hypothetical protein